MKDQRRQFANAVLLYCCTAVLVLLGASLGRGYFRPVPSGGAKTAALFDVFANRDGKWYVRILKDGYHYQPRTYSDVAFFPAFPLLGRGVSWVTGLSSHLALLFVAHACLLSSFVLVGRYAVLRMGKAESDAAHSVLLGFAFWPTTFFFRMAYSESLFLLIEVLVLYGMEKEWPATVLALLTGVATATRPIGFALLPSLAWHLWESPGQSRRFLRLAVFLPLASWGLGAFMAYQWFAFGDPWAFAKNQEFWRARPSVPFAEKAVSLLMLGPVWSVFDPSSPCYWENHEVKEAAFFSLQLANPLYFLATAGLIMLGASKRWLNCKEILLAAGFLIVPYVTRSQEMCMGSMGRFCAVVLPQYLVIGQLLARVPGTWAGSWVAVFGFFLGCYTALFAAGYRFF